MKKILILILIAIFAIRANAQNQEQQSDIEKNVETAAVSIRGALINNQNIDLNAHIDTLEKYLYQAPASLKLSVKYFAIFTLNGYYLEKQIPKVNYNELIEALMVTRKFDSFYDPFYFNCAYGLGIEYENQGLYARAIDSYELALKVNQHIFQDTPNVNSYDLLTKIQNLYFSKQKDFPKCVDILEKKLPLSVQILGKDNKFYINDLGILSLVYQFNNQYEKSDSCLFILQNYFEKNNLQHSAEYIDVLDKRANAKRMLPIPQHKEAIKLYEKILSLQKDGTPEYAYTLYEMAMCYREQEDLKKTILYADKSANIAQKNPNENIDLLFSLIQLYKNSNGTEQARKLIKNLSFAPKDNLFLLSKIAYMYALVDNFSQAHKFVEQAKIQADKRIASGDVTFDFSNELGELSNALILLDEIEDAIKYQEISLDITKQTLGENHSISRQMRILLSGMYPLIGDYDKALNILDVLAQDKNEPDYLDILHKQADLYSSIGNFDKAISNYKAILIKQPNPLTKWQVLLSLTGCYISIADLLRDEKKNNETASQINNAQEYALQLLNLSKEEFGTNSEQYILSLNQIAAVYCLQDSIQTARKYADICLKTINRNHFGYSERASYLWGLAFVYAEMKDFSKAIKLGEEAKKIEQKINSKNVLAEDLTLFLLSESYLGNNNYGKAQYYYADLYRKLSDNIAKNFSYMTEQQRENYLRMYQNQLYNAGKFIDVSNKKDIFAAVVYDVSLFSKGLLLRTTNDIRDAIYFSGNDELIKQYEELGNLRKQIGSLLQKVDYNKELVETLQNQAEQLEKSVTQSPQAQAYRDIKADISMTWQDVQKQLKSDEAAIEFVYYNLSDRTMYAALVLRSNMKVPVWIPLCEQAQLDDILRVTTDNTDRYVNFVYKTSGKKLYNLIWEALEKELSNVETVYYSPLGLLHKISFNAIPTEKENVLLSSKYNLHLVSSTREIARLKKETGFIIMQDTTVVYGGLTYNSEEWKYLAGTKAEAEQIVSLLENKNNPYQYFTENQGNEKSFKHLSGTKTGIIHLATHGFFLTDIEKKLDDNLVQHLRGNKEKPFENPLLRSGLIMSDANNQWFAKEYIMQDGIENGILTADEIAKLNLTKTKLVVLSACETGLGDVKNSEGIFGLQRAFKLAGVESLIMSLWKVPDEATAELMTTFYQEWLSGEGKQKAFKTAQEKVREKYQSPFFWAAFVLLD